MKWTPAAKRLNMYLGFKNVYMENTNPIDIINRAKHANDAWVLVRSNRSIKLKRKKWKKRKKWEKIQNHQSLLDECAFHFGWVAHNITQRADRYLHRKLQLLAIVHKREIQCYGRYLHNNNNSTQYARHVRGAPQMEPVRRACVSIVYAISTHKCLIKSSK